MVMVDWLFFWWGMVSRIGSLYILVCVCGKKKNSQEPYWIYVCSV